MGIWLHPKHASMNLVLVFQTSCGFPVIMASPPSSLRQKHIRQYRNQNQFLQRVHDVACPYVWCTIDGTTANEFKVILPKMQLYPDSHGTTRNLTWIVLIDVGSPLFLKVVVRIMNPSGWVLVHNIVGAMVAMIKSGKSSFGVPSTRLPQEMVETIILVDENVLMEKVNLSDLYLVVNDVIF
ncbi:hypothetical protein A2U01_0005804 [Trifolium medium]|uniref:DUF4283 domain protein n=1 Tax=Trifolium medium TaxID=97028 RepID=A0A392MBZ5_9FABA|nr:hypothetical protein [Trifolium medium]